MTPVTAEQYLRGYDALYPGECTEVIRANAARTVERVNQLLAELERGGVELEAHPRTGSIISSGWRPVVVNRQVPNAAPRSRHMSAEACDLYDPDGLLDEWCFNNQHVLEEIGLWMEHPGCTKGWLHVQCVPPRSGRTVFFP